MIPLTVMVLLVLVQINHEHKGETVNRWGLTTDNFCRLLHTYISLQKIDFIKI
jgi:hypothetical protein